MKKTVSNLLSDISTARDLILRGDINEINRKYKECLTEIKPILELYANSKIGEEQLDGTYKLSGSIWDSFGFCTTTYDPRPAREGLKKISEVGNV